MRRMLRKLSLVNKITVVVVCILLIPIFLFCIFYGYQYRQAIYSNAEKQLQDEVEAVRRIIENKSTDIENAIRDIAYSQEFLYFFDSRSKISEREKKGFLLGLQEEWYTLCQVYPNLFQRMMLYSSNNSIELGFHRNLSLMSLDEFPNIETAYKNEDVWCGELTSLKMDDELSHVVNSKDIFIPVYINIRNFSTNEIIGIIELDILFEKLIDSNLIKEREENLDYIFVNKRGESIYEIGDRNIEKGEYLISTKMLRDENVNVAKLDDDYYRIRTLQNGKLGVNCIVGIKEKKLASKVNNISIKIVWIAVLGGIVVLIGARVMLKKMLNRLVDLDIAMEQLESGNFCIQFEDDGYEDEVSRIKSRFRQMAYRLQKVMDEMVEREKALKEAELQALQAQINPHFLFNTLETMRMQCEIDRYYKIGNALMSLGEMFHYIIGLKGYSVPFYKEWENLENYISLMALRLDDDLKYELICDEEVKNILVPKMLLQPVVENSFTHGFKKVSPPWYLKVHAQIENGNLKITIRDNGTGVDDNKINILQEAMASRSSYTDGLRDKQSIGLINVLKRIDYVCASGSDIKIENKKNGGIEICIIIVNNN